MLQTHSVAALEDRKLFSYEEYRDSLEKMVHGEPSDFPVQPGDKVRFLPINLQRMRRMEKTLSLQPDLQKLLLNIHTPLLWVVIAEPWCGDGAQNLPVFHRMAHTNPLIELKIILRDTNSDFMDQYLTDGKRSIPILICYNAETGEELFTWGARPSSLEKEIVTFKEQNPGYDHDSFLVFVHGWYAKDKGNGVQEDFVKLISNFNV